MKASRFLRQPRNVSFSSDKTLFDHMSTFELARSIAVFGLCGAPFVVKHSMTALTAAERVVGPYLAYETVVKGTMFAHFCGGTNEESLKPTIKRLGDIGIGPILDYAAEAPAGSEASSDVPQSTAEVDVNMWSMLNRTDLVYGSEDGFDENMERLLSCVETTAGIKNKDGIAFAAVKFTALCDQQLLARTTAMLLALRQGWFRICRPGETPPKLEDCRIMLGVKLSATDDQSIDIPAFRLGLTTMCKGALTEAQLDRLVTVFDKNGDCRVDYFEFTHTLAQAMLHQTAPTSALAVLLRELPTLTDEEQRLWNNFKARADRVAQRAEARGVRLLVDAEQTFYQMAIDHSVRRLQRLYNRKVPTVYNTYQCYMTITRRRLANDMERARREGIVWGGKMVRGAYMDQERKVAAHFNYPSPILADIGMTHESYDACGNFIMDAAADGPPLGVLFGSHNEASLKMLSDRLVAMGDSKQEVAFGQLLGMGDHLTIPMAKAGFNVFKYVPYGPVKETMLYLHRRALENSAMLNNSGGEVALLTAALWGRVRGFAVVFVVVWVVAGAYRLGQRAAANKAAAAKVVADKAAAEKAVAEKAAAKTAALKAFAAKAVAAKAAAEKAAAEKAAAETAAAEKAAAEKADAEKAAAEKAAAVAAAEMVVSHDDKDSAATLTTNTTPERR
jgi:proline dehydrogenase